VSPIPQERGSPGHSPRWRFPFFLFLTLSALVALLNRHHGDQQANYWNEYVAMAEYFRGHASREVLTYPTWGYPFVLWLLPRYSWIVAVQVVLGAGAMTWAYQRLKLELPAQGRIVTAACLAALPWYALQSVKWPLSFAGSFLLLAVLTLDSALRRSRILLGVVAGFLLGAVLYFRSEFLLIPLFLPLFYAVANRRWLRWREAAIFALAGLTAFVLLLPWAVHYKRQTGRYSLTASQKGIVSFISLGQLPGNPWGAEYLDEYAYAYLATHGGKTPNSDLADRILFEEYKRRVAQHPGAFVKKVLWNGGMILAKGFYNPEPRLDSSSNREYESLRSALRRADLGSLTKPASVGASIAFLYWVTAKALGVTFFLLGMLGLLIWPARGSAASTLLALCAGVIVYQVVLQMFLAAEPRYLNGLYLYVVPFLAICVSTLRRRFSGGVSAPAPSPS
jgi:hypothetical protein